MASHTPQPTSPRSGLAELEISSPSAALHALDVLNGASWYGTLAVASVAVCGSLFFSEVLGWLPCVLVSATAQVEQDLEATVGEKANQTPTFVINGERYPGVMGVDEFRQNFAQHAPDITFD